MPFIIAVDYDDTINFGTIGDDWNPNQPVIDKVKEFKKAGAEVALWTCRERESLNEAVERCTAAGLEFDAINANTPAEMDYIARKSKGGEPAFAQSKIYADIYVDDKAPGSIEYFLKIDVKQTCAAFAHRERK